MTRMLRRALSWAVWGRAPDDVELDVVVCHEWFVSMAGSDKVAVRLARIAGAKVMFVFAADAELVDSVADSVRVIESRVGRLGRSGSARKLSLAIMPIVWRCLDLSAARLVITSSHSTTNAVESGEAVRVCYCHTPVRYGWDWRLEAGRLPRPLRPFLGLPAAVLRWFDLRWSRRVHSYVANSTFVADRIRTYYGKESTVIAPPIDTDFFCFGDEPVDRANQPFLFAGRFVPYKRPDLAILASVGSGSEVTVAGGGPELERLRRLASSSVSFVVEPSDDELRDLLRSARALLFPGVEDFGMIVPEALACGCPVIALASGGVLDTVVDGVHGILIDNDSVLSWEQTLQRFDPGRFDPVVLRAAALHYSADRFDERIGSLIAEAIGNHRPDRP